MDTKENTILAISVGTRNMGVALMRSKTLRDWQTKTFKSAWSDQKLQHIITTIEGYIDMHGVNTIAIKVPHNSRSSDGIVLLIKALIFLAEARKITIKSYTITDLKVYALQLNKKGLLAYASQKYPDLYTVITSRDRKHSTYHIRAVEAIVACELSAEINPKIILKEKRTKKKAHSYK